MIEKKTVFITGAIGMDGSILSERYLEKDYRVVAIDLWNPLGEYPNLKNCFGNENFALETGDITDKHFIYGLFQKYKPEIIYNMGAISLVPESFKIPHRIFDVNTMGVINILEMIKHFSPSTKFYQASTSEMIGNNTEIPQNTESRMLPNSPYAISKLASYHLVRYYRQAYEIFACNGMLWNHEGPRRGKTFVTRKISMAIAGIKKGTQNFVSLGNLDASRDWGYADEFVDGMIKIMEADKPDDYAINTGETHTIREFVEEAFKCAGIDITWKGEGLTETGIDQNGKIRVNINEKYYRPVEVPLLHGDHSKITKELGWEPKTKFKELVRMMVESDLRGE